MPVPTKTMSVDVVGRSDTPGPSPPARLRAWCRSGQHVSPIDTGIGGNGISCPARVDSAGTPHGRTRVVPVPLSFFRPRALGNHPSSTSIGISSRALSLLRADSAPRSTSFLPGEDRDHIVLVNDRGGPGFDDLAAVADPHDEDPDVWGSASSSVRSCSPDWVRHAVCAISKNFAPETRPSSHSAAPAISACLRAPSSRRLILISLGPIVGRNQTRLAVPTR